jgi:hypothetical protein
MQGEGFDLSHCVSTDQATLLRYWTPEEKPRMSISSLVMWPDSTSEIAELSNVLNNLTKEFVSLEEKALNTCRDPIG